MNESDNESILSEDSDVAFAYVDFKGVDFGSDESNKKTNNDDDDQNCESMDDTKNIVTSHNDNEVSGCDENTKGNIINSNEQNDSNSNILDKILLDSSKLISDHGMDDIRKNNDEISSSQHYESQSSRNNLVTFTKVIAEPSILNKGDELALDVERTILASDCTESISDDDNIHDGNETLSEVHDRIKTMAKQICNGDYIDVLGGPSVDALIQTIQNPDFGENISVSQRIREMVMRYCTTTSKCVEVELLAIAAFNLFLQVNYTGPSLHHGGVARPGKEERVHSLSNINPHPVFASQLQVSTNEESKNENQGDSNLDEPKVDAAFQNAVLAELSVDGEWPCPVCKYPYFLLVARSIFLTLADPNRPDWSHSFVNHSKNNNLDQITIRKDASSSVYFSMPSVAFVGNTQHLSSCQLWSARATVAHIRLLQADEPSSLNLWTEAKTMFEVCKTKFCDESKFKDEADRQRASKLLLEYGLSEHHFDVNKKGKPLFEEALKYANLDVEVTGAQGRRTKYQQDSTAQMLVRAKPTVQNESVNKADNNENIGKQFIDHQDETILLDKIKYVEDDDNVHFELSILQQTILLALCLDVKNKNPMDGLTAEEMGAFLERVLQQHDDWMVYATGLLERAWLECERNHTRERAILQIQALVDQHTNRLTLTQSTFQAAVEDSAPPQDRLKHIHYIVYPPRWSALKDLAERYAKMGIVTSAAEIFEEIELWDEVVECYRRAGKEHKAEEVVRSRLAIVETPRMWAALGDITKDSSYYERALEVSKGKYSGAYVALGKHFSDKGDFNKAAKYFHEAVIIKPLSPHVWFRLGAISMRINDWSTALQAFTEVVQQEPEEGDAWANVAAIHMHNRQPSEAYPALLESLKLNRNNWRVWVSKLYTCMDLKKYDEAIQACQVLIDLKSKRNASEGIPFLEERVIRGIVGGVISVYKEATMSEDAPAIDSAKRSVTRVRELLTKLTSTMKSEPWLYEISAFFHESVGCDDLALENLMMEYRSIQSIRGWETDSVACPKICQVILQISELKLRDNDSGELKKFKFLVKGVINKIKAAYFDESKLPTNILDDLNKIIERVGDKI